MRLTLKKKQKRTQQAQKNSCMCLKKFKRMQLFFWKRKVNLPAIVSIGIPNFLDALVEENEEKLKILDNILCAKFPKYVLQSKFPNKSSQPFYNTPLGLVVEEDVNE